MLVRHYVSGAAPAAEHVFSSLNMDHAIKLADWILCRYPYWTRDSVTHLKLQKLAFYAYGAALAHNVDGDIGEIAFEAWEHGPVSRVIWQVNRDKGATPLAKPSHVQRYSLGTEQVLSDTLAVYGCLSAWALRQQSHTEKPWTDAWNSDDHSIPTDGLRSYFKAKFQSGNVRIPEHLLAGWSLTLDGLTEPRFDSLHGLAELVQSSS